jgi:hypothetical protein
MLVLCVNGKANLVKICGNPRALEFPFRLNLFVAMTHHVLNRAKHNTQLKVMFSGHTYIKL